LADDAGGIGDEYAAAHAGPYPCELDQAVHTLSTGSLRGPLLEPGGASACGATRTANNEFLLACVMRTRTNWRPSSPSPEKWTISLRSVRPLQCSPLPRPSTKTSCSLPTRLARCRWRSVLLSSKSSASRRLFSASSTSSPSLSAGVKGRGEYLKPNTPTKPT